MTPFPVKNTCCRWSANIKGYIDSTVVFIVLLTLIPTPVHVWKALVFTLSISIVSTRIEHKYPFSQIGSGRQRGEKNGLLRGGSHVI